MNSNDSNILNDIETASQDSFNIEYNSSNWLLRNQNLGTNKTNNEDLEIANENISLQSDKKDLKKTFTQTSIGSSDKPNGVTSANEEIMTVSYNSDQEYLNVTNNKKDELNTIHRRKSSYSYNGKNNINNFLDNDENIETSERIIFYCKENNHIQRVNSFQELKKVGQNSISETMKKNFFWFDILNPTKEEITILSDVFGIHLLTVEDIEFDDTREKIETFLNYYFLSVSSFEQNSYTYIQPISVSILVFKNCVLSFHKRPTPHPDNILKRIMQLSLYDFQVNGDWLAYAHIDDIADSFMPYLRTIEIDVDSIDELVLILKESEQNDMLRRIGLARKHVTSLLRLLTDKADIIKIFIKRLSTLSPKSETLLYLSDVQDHIITMVQNLSHYDKTLTRAHSNYLAQITIEITLTASRTNDIVMKITALGSIFLPLNVITGMWGMNVTVPGQTSDTYNSFLPFTLIVITMILVSLSVLFFSKRLGMI